MNSQWNPLRDFRSDSYKKSRGKLLTEIPKELLDKFTEESLDFLERFLDKLVEDLPVDILGDS